MITSPSLCASSDKTGAVDGLLSFRLVNADCHRKGDFSTFTLQSCSETVYQVNVGKWGLQCSVGRLRGCVEVVGMCLDLPCSVSRLKGKHGTASVFGSVQVHHNEKTLLNSSPAHRGLFNFSAVIPSSGRSYQSNQTFKRSNVTEVQRATR